MLVGRKTYQGGWTIFNQLLDVYPGFIGETPVHYGESKAIATLKTNKRFNF